MIELFDAKKMKKLKFEYQLVQVVIALIAVVTVGAIYLICKMTGTLNASDMELKATIIFLLAGWVEIYLIINVYLSKKAQTLHGQMLSEDERTEVTGPAEVGKNRIKIKDSVTVRQVRVKTQDGTKTLNIVEDRAKEIEKIEGPVKFQVVHGYIAAYEAEHENN